jgi:hypothetical protein
MTIDKDLTLKIESQIDDLRRYKDSMHLGALLVAVEQLLGPQHLLIAILRSIFAYDMTGIIGMSERFFSAGDLLLLLWTATGVPVERLGLFVGPRPSVPLAGRTRTWDQCYDFKIVH